MVEVSLTVGKLDASLALLLTKDHHLIEFPTILLPNGVRAGSIVKIKCEQDLDTEIEEAKQFQVIQDEILDAFGKNLPENPILKIKNVTQTSCVLEWEPLVLGTANLKNLVLYKDGKKLGSIPSPLTNSSTKLSGLPIDKTFQFHLRLDTSAGVYSSEPIEVTTHKMTDLSGITVCLGDIGSNEQFTVEDIEEALKNMGAHHPAQSEIKVDTTHFICTRENKQNSEYLKACEMNIPVVRPEWLKACERERRIVGVRDFYVKDCVLPDIFSKNYWKKDSDAKVETHKTGDDEVPDVDAVEEKEKTEEGSETAPSEAVANGERQEDSSVVEDVASADINNDTGKEQAEETKHQEETTKNDTLQGSNNIEGETTQTPDIAVVDGTESEPEPKIETQDVPETETKSEVTPEEKVSESTDFEEVELSEKSKASPVEEEQSKDISTEVCLDQSTNTEEDSNTEAEGTKADDLPPNTKAQPKSSKKKKNKKKKN